MGWRMSDLKWTRWHQDGYVATIWLDRPPLNLLCEEMKDELLGILAQIEADERLRVIILTGAGQKAFCAGRNLQESRSWQEAGDPSLLKAVWDRGNRLIDCVLSYPKITIAALNGLALGGGCELTLPFDFVIAERTVKIGLPEARRGLFPGTGAMKLLPKKVGLFRAREMIFLGKVLDAGDALAWGLVNMVVDQKALDAAYELAARLRTVSFGAILQAKAIMNSHEGWPSASSLGEEQEAFWQMFLTPDAREGVRAFFEKRNPRFDWGSEPSGGR